MSNELKAMIIVAAGLKRGVINLVPQVSLEETTV